MTKSIPHPEGKTKVFLNLVGTDSHALSIIGLFTRTAKKQGFNSEWIAEVRDEMMSGDYNNVISTALKYSTTQIEESHPVTASSEKKEQEEYRPQFWDETHPLSKERERLIEEWIPYQGKCIDPNTGEIVPYYEALVRIGTFNYDIYNNGGCNDYTDEAETYLYYMNQFKEFFSSEEDYKKIQNILQFYIEKKKWLEEYAQCEECDGYGYTEVEEEEYNYDTEEYETVYVDETCEWCNGNGVEEREFNFLDWFEKDSDRMRLLDEAIAAPVRYVLSLEKKGKLVRCYDNCEMKTK